ncbi:MAG: fimbrial protein [Klebsiella huaxiensis]|uniref:fimbrial protein n=1 Tax=Klebsiella huaxiensis TaxID=2153354 RepID=UPI0026F24C6B|nr:fimbrial protein [Klebsiella huaxiensis]WEJ88813.1 MAG: fimbrial protein [Klebsiella huaxiensis]
MLLKFFYSFKKSVVLLSSLPLCIGVLIQLSTFSVEAAECTSAPNIMLYLTPSTNTLSIDPTLPVGSVLATASASWAQGVGPCMGRGSIQINGEGTPNGKIYPTTVPGIGYRAKLTTSWDSRLTGFWPTTTLVGNNITFGPEYFDGTILVEFLKTGPVSAAGGIYGPAKIGSLDIVGGVGSGEYFVYYLNSPITILPTLPACTLVDSVISVTLPDVKQSSLNVAGKTDGDTRFNIPLKCDRTADISLSFSGDATHPSNGVFKNTNAENSDYVGIQLLDKNGTPVSSIEEEYSVIGDMNGSSNYPMTARYYTIIPGSPAGSVNAVVYATLVYN